MAKKGKGEKKRSDDGKLVDGEKRKLAKDLRLSLKLRGELDRTFVALERAIEAQADTGATAVGKKGKTSAGSSDLALALRAHKVSVQALAYGDGGGGF